MNMPVKKKKLAILGSTGSIGRQTLDVVRAYPDRFLVAALTAGQNLDLLTEQILEFKPAFISYTSRDKRLSVPVTCTFLQPEEIASLPEVDTVVVATAGISGLTPTLAAARASKTIALANKETLVMAGDFVKQAVAEGNAELLPLDSEHSAIWQCLQGETTFPTRLILTASGGPFCHYTANELERVTPAQALKHPSWKMGRKITIDSATLINKGFEVIEAHYLFDMPFENIDILVHPECIIHSMVEFADGAIKAQLGCPDMRIPIQYALSYPERLDSPEFPHLNFKSVRNLTFEEPDVQAFPGLEIAIEAGKKGGTYPAVLAGADEVAVALFLKGKIRFTDIPRLVEKTLSSHTATASPSLEEIIFAENWAQGKTAELAAGAKTC
jgi:1-deoxy-D-xylulose-5-phosphate reductoisomerase